jgi:membrane protease YdiL (CAAX protease family)
MMTNWVGVTGFLVAAAVASLAWGKILWYCNERSDTFRRFLFRVLSCTYDRPAAVQSLLLGVVYFTFGFFVAALLTVAFSVPAAAVFAWSGFSWPLVVIGAVGEISLAALLVEIGCRIPTQAGPDRLAKEILEIPWVKGVEQLPGLTAPIFAAIGGSAEELFFRGIVLTAVIHRYHVDAAFAITITSVLFCVQQALQVRTRLQALLMVCSCLSISLVGGLLVVATGTVVPAILCHASFVLFFVSRVRKPAASEHSEDRIARVAQ